MDSSLSLCSNCYSLNSKIIPFVTSVLSGWSEIALETVSSTSISLFDLTQRESQRLGMDQLGHVAVLSLELTEKGMNNIRDILQHPEFSNSNPQISLKKCEAAWEAKCHARYAQGAQVLTHCFSQGRSVSPNSLQKAKLQSPSHSAV